MLLDTDVFSFMIKPGDTRGVIYRNRVQGKRLCVCFVTIGELLFGAYKKRWSQQNIERLKSRLRSVVIVPFDYAVCQTYASLKSSLAPGVCVADNDLWIAACAVRHSIPLVSHNRKHFEKIPGLILETEAPVIREIESQTKMDYEPLSRAVVGFGPQTVTSTESELPSEQSPSSEPKKE